MKLHRTENGVVLEHERRFFPLDDDLDALINHSDLLAHLRAIASTRTGEAALAGRVVAPIGRQEVWAAGVTYYRSRVARLEESQQAGGGSFYDRVYEAERPELFFKAAPWRVRAPGEPVRIRRDAGWNVPEPEIALCINARGRIIGYTIGNDMSARDIEGENPLYLPQAKIYDGACALGPALLITDEPLPADTAIELMVTRSGTTAYSGRTTFSQMRRAPSELVQYLYRETSFPHGCMLLTGTGIVPPDNFSLQPGDQVRIHVPPIGTLTNVVARDGEGASEAKTAVSARNRRWTEAQ